MFHKIKNIIVGNVRKLLGYKSDLGTERLKICNACDQKLNITRNEAICKQCGCLIKAKVLMEDEKCLMNK